MKKQVNLVPLLTIIIISLIFIIVTLYQKQNSRPITRYESISPRLEPTPLNIPVKIVQD